MNKLVLGLAIASSFSLAGCGHDDGPDEPKIPQGSASGGVQFTKAVYAPGDGEIPLPNDLLFNGSEDLTLNIPVEDPTNFADPQVALSALDGWSAVAPISIEFKGFEGATIQPSSIQIGSSVRVFRVTALREEVMPGIIAPSGPPVAIEAELSAAQIVAVPSPLDPNAIALLPLTPLMAQSTYMVVLTDGITDSNGNALVADNQYSLAKLESPLTGSDTQALEPVRQLVNQMENVAASEGIAKEDIILSFHFTVQSIGDVMFAAKQVDLDLPASVGSLPSTSFSSLMTDTTPFTGIGAANLYKGEIELNYYSGIPTASNPVAAVSDFWVGRAMVPNPADPAQMVPNPLAGGFTTYANKLPEIRGVETVPLLVSVPKNPACAKPYPVMMFQHGITSNRTAMLGIADTMASVCTAVVAMDLPLHGIKSDNEVHLGLQAASGGMLGIFAGYNAGDVRERTFGVDYVTQDAEGNILAASPDGVVDTSGAHTINLTNLLVSRDNQRQAVMDLMNLEKAIPMMDIDGDMIPDFDASQVSFMGHSLGGIVGSTYLAFAGTPGLVTVESAVVANPGGGIAYLLNGSERFGPTIRGGLANAFAGEDITNTLIAQGITPGTEEFAQAFSQALADFQNTSEFAEALTGFLFAAQTVIDSGDPINHAETALAVGIPTLMQEVVGDTVVPNSVATAPLAGTEPLAREMGLTQYSTTTTDAEGLRAFVVLNEGTHSSVLDPTLFPAVTQEMQTQIANFVASKGTAVVITNEDLVD